VLLHLLEQHGISFHHNHAGKATGLLPKRWQLPATH
jgi:hypothetical protein